MKVGFGHRFGCAFGFKHGAHLFANEKWAARNPYQPWHRNQSDCHLWLFAMKCELRHVPGSPRGGRNSDRKDSGRHHVFECIDTYKEIMRSSGLLTLSSSHGVRTRELP